MTPSELQIHIGIVQLLKFTAAPGVVYLHCPNGELRDKRAAAKLKAMGVRPGVADLMLLIPQGSGPAITAFMEIKRPGERLSAAQEQFRDDVQAIGCLWDVVFSIDRAADVLREWRAIRGAASAAA